jgi:hypothetical protein
VCLNLRNVHLSNFFSQNQHSHNWIRLKIWGPYIWSKTVITGCRMFSANLPFRLYSWFCICPSKCPLICRRTVVATLSLLCHSKMKFILTWNIESWTLIGSKVTTWNEYNCFVFNTYWLLGNHVILRVNSLSTMSWRLIKKLHAFNRNHFIFSYLKQMLSFQEIWYLKDN